MNRTPLTRRDAALALAVAVLTAAVYAPVVRCGFVDWDDWVYVYRNPHVLAGPGFGGLFWALTAVEAANWHPATWVSLQLDAMMWGVNPVGYHLTNLLLHAANAGLVYLVLRLLTGATGRSFAVALLWGLHPLHVESVAWVSERKDVLCAFFWLLTVGAYARYARGPTTWGRFLPVVVGCGLALMAKPMAVTLPCTLLLLDAWPLGRLRSRGGIGPLVREKAVLFLLVAGSCALTVYAQTAGSAIRGGDELPPGARAVNVVTAYAAYLRQTVWPADLAGFYPLPATPPPTWRWGTSAVTLLALTGFAVALRRRAPYLLVGWLWFLGTLVPVVGVVHVGGQSHADRYTYVPHIGLFLAVVWGLADLCGRVRVPRGVRWAVVAGLAVACAAVTREQIPHWRDSVALWGRVVAVSPDSAFGWSSLARSQYVAGDLAAAARSADAALRLEPDAPLARTLRDSIPAASRPR